MKKPVAPRAERAEKATVILLCRPGFEAVLREELSLGPDEPFSAPTGASRVPSRVGFPTGGVGWVSCRLSTGQIARRLTRPLMFERQRLTGARFLPGRTVDALARTVADQELHRLSTLQGPCTLHVFTPDPTGERSLSGRAAALEKAVLRRWEGGPSGTFAAYRTPEAFREDGGALRSGTVWQLCVVGEEGVDGVWSAFSPASALADPFPGGVHRVPMDALAPSRSYLKIEEALAVLAGESWGAVPRPRETVIDLGAAPGGWSYAFLRRGCRVMAVDNGPLKLGRPDHLGGELRHLREDGLRFAPPPGWVPVDWLLSDMLVPPGVGLGLLRRWLGAGWVRRFIVNLKLPQHHPLTALRPVQAYLSGVPGLAWRMRQLYHDRREVTLLGCRIADPEPVRARERLPKGRRSSPSQAPRKSRKPRRR